MPPPQTIRNINLDRLRAVLDKLQISPGTVLALAREIVEDQTLISINKLCDRDRRNLSDYLRYLLYAPEPELFATIVDHSATGRYRTAV